MKRVVKAANEEVERLRKARDEYEADYEKRHQEYQEQRNEYYKAQHAVFDPVKEYIENMLASPVLDFEVNVDSGRFGEPGLEVKVRCNDRKLHDETTALAWNFTARLSEDGEVLKETGSWSGLRAVTEVQIASLEASVHAIKLLNSMDWPTILNKTLPSYRDYVTVSDYRGDRPNFEQQIKEAELKDYIGQPIALQGTGLESLGYSGYSKAKVWYIITRETPKKYIVYDFSEYNANSIKSNFGYEDPQDVINYIMDKYTPSQIKKEYLVAALKYPFIEFGEE